MKFNYAREKRIFDKEWERLQREYQDAGMHESAIEEMKALDWGWFCSRRVHLEHTQPFPEENMNDKGYSLLFQKFESLSSYTELEFGRYGWLNGIEDVELYQKLKSLGMQDLELLTLIIMDGYSQSDVAKRWNCSRSAINKRMKKIRKILCSG